MTGEPAGGLNPPERAELARLRAEVARLRAGARPPRPPRRWLRGTAAGLLIALACLLAPLSVIAVWARGEVTDTDRYVATVAPLARDPAVQAAITADLTATIFRYVDVEGLTRQAFTALADKGSLPPRVADRLADLAGPLAGGVRSFTADRVGDVVRSDVFADAWVAANRAAHQQLVAALRGQTGGGVAVQGDAVTVDLAAFLDVVKQRLVARGFGLANRIPPVHATFVIFESADVHRVQRGFALLDTLGYWLPAVLTVLAAAGIWLAPNHRQAFIATGLGVAAAMLGTGAGLAVVRRAYLNGVPPAVLPRDAAGTLYDTVVRFLRDGVRAGFLAGLVVAAAAFLTGPAPVAVAVRRWLVAGFARARGGLVALGLRLDGVTGWVAPRATLLRVLVVAAAGAALLLRRYRTPGLVVWLTAAALAGLAVVQLLASRPRQS